MYISKIDKYIDNFKKCFKIDIAIYVLVLLFINNKDIVIFYIMGHVAFCFAYAFIICSKIFYEQDVYIEKNHKDIYAKYNKKLIKPTGIALHEAEKKNYPRELENLINDAKKANNFFGIIYIVAALSSLLEFILLWLKTYFIAM